MIINTLRIKPLAPSHSLLYDISWVYKRWPFPTIDHFYEGYDSLAKNQSLIERFIRMASHQTGLGKSLIDIPAIDAIALERD